MCREHIELYMIEELVQDLGEITDQNDPIYFLEDIGICVFIERSGDLVLYGWDGAGFYKEGWWKGNKACIRCGQDPEEENGNISLAVMAVMSSSGIDEQYIWTAFDTLYSQGEPQSVGGWFSQSESLCPSCQDELVDGIEESIPDLVSRIM